MKRRWPLWLAIVPLLIGGGVYWWFWSGWRDDFRADIARVVQGAMTTIGGFPYRLEGDVAGPRVERRGPVTISIAATSAVANRGPWQRDLTVVRTTTPRVAIAVPALAGASLQLDAATGVASIHLDDGRLARQSNVFTAVRAVTGLIAVPVTAVTFEVHARETTPRSNEAWSATPPEQAQIVLSGTGVRLGGGAPLTLAAELGVTGVARLRDYAGWAAGGTVELRSLTLADASGEVLRLAATAVPTGGRLRLGGTISTVCPASVRAAFAGLAASRELRARVPVRLAFEGGPGTFRLATSADAAPARAVRSQLPPCPRLR